MCVCTPVQSRAGHQRGTTFTPSPCSALKHSWAPLRPLGVSGTGMCQVCQDGDQFGGLCNLPASLAPGRVTRTDRLVSASRGAGAAPPQPCAPRGSWAGWGLQGGQGCLCPPASLRLCLSPAPWSPLQWIKH